VSSPSPHARRTLLALAFASAAVGAAGCGSKAPAVTGLTVTITMVGVSPDQLQLTVTTPDGFVLDPMLRPMTPAGFLSSPQSITIFLPDALAAQVATCTVTPFYGGQPTGSPASGSSTLLLHQLVPLQIDLPASRHDDDAGAPEAGAADSATEASASDGGGGSGGTDGASPKANGQPCAAGGDCDSTLCSGGVCCASACTGICEACNLAGKEGTCSPVPSGTVTKCAKQPDSMCMFDGTCDGNGGCRLVMAGVVCKAESCSSASSYMPASACDGQGKCVPANTVDCAPYICGAKGCLTTCAAGGTDCFSPAVCTNGSCGARPLKDNGAGCVGNTDCKSAHCADGVCCDGACTGACVACNVTGTAGMCKSVGAGKVDPHAVCKDAGATSCGKNGLCDGAGACALYPTTTACAAGSCKAATLTNPKRCDGKGACVAVNPTDCTPYRCDPANTACFTSCTLSLQCVSRRACVNSACQ
jgi:hypothetical protein